MHLEPAQILTEASVESVIQVLASFKKICVKLNQKF